MCCILKQNLWKNNFMRIWNLLGVSSCPTLLSRKSSACHCLIFNSQNVLFNPACKRKDVGYLTEMPEKSKSTGKRASSNLGAQDMFYSNGFLSKGKCRQQEQRKDKEWIENYHSEGDRECVNLCHPEISNDITRLRSYASIGYKP